MFISIDLMNTRRRETGSRLLQFKISNTREWGIKTACLTSLELGEEELSTLRADILSSEFTCRLSFAVGVNTFLSSESKKNTSLM